MYSEPFKAQVLVNGRPFHVVFDEMTAQNLLDFHKGTMPQNAPSHIYNLTPELSGIMTSHFEPRHVSETVQEYAQRLLDLGVDADCRLGRFLKGFPWTTMSVAEVAAFVVPDMVVITSYGEEMVDTEPVRPLTAYRPFKHTDLSVTVMTREAWHASKVQKQVEKQEERVAAAASAELVPPQAGQVQQGEKRSREDFEQKEPKEHREDVIIIDDDEEAEQAAAEELIVPKTTTKRGRKHPQFDWLVQYDIDKKAFNNDNMTYSKSKCSDTGAILMTTHLKQRSTIVDLFPNGHVSKVHHAHEGSRFYVFVNFPDRTARSNAMNAYKEIVHVRGDKPRTNANMVLFIKSLAPRLSETERNGFLDILESKVVQPIEPVFRLQEQEEEEEEERPQFPFPPFEDVAMQFPPATTYETDSFPVFPAREEFVDEHSSAALESLGVDPLME